MKNEVNAKNLAHIELIEMAIRAIKMNHDSDCLICSLPNYSIETGSVIGELSNLLGYSSAMSWINDNNYWGQPVSVLCEQANDYICTFYDDVDLQPIE